jgi:hypothetical protein
MVLAIGSDGTGLGIGALQPAQRTGVPAQAFPPNSASPPNGTTPPSDGKGQPAQPVIGFGQALLAPGTARQAQEQGQSEPQTGHAKAADGSDLTAAQEAEVAKLKQIDQAVKAHERAHAATGGQLAGAPSYTYVQGPDGQRYAVAGEVAISTGSGNDGPAATIRKAEQVIAAALAPADPSGQDRAVAASAQQLKLQAEAELAKQQTDKAKDGGPGQGAPTGQQDTQSQSASQKNAATVRGVGAYQQAATENAPTPSLSLSS